MSLQTQISQIELNNISMDDIFHALLVLTSIDLDHPKHCQIMLTPLVEAMGELIDKNESAIEEAYKAVKRG